MQRVGPTLQPQMDAARGIETPDLHQQMRLEIEPHLQRLQQKRVA